MNPDLLAGLETLLVVWVALSGACVGSFLNVCIYRLPRECMTVSRPKRSFCPNCGRKLRLLDNVPILAWLALRGRCAGCKVPISLRYPLVEALTMIVWGWLASRILPGQIASPEAWGTLLIHVSFASALIVCAGTDLDHRWIPDRINIPGMLLAPVVIALVPAALPYGPLDVPTLGRSLEGVFGSPLAWWGLEHPAQWLAALSASPPSPRLGAFGASLLGALLGAGFMRGVSVVFGRLLSPEAMGGGDVKMMAMIGAVVGWQGLVGTLLVAVASGSVIGLAYMAATGRGQPLGSDLAAESPAGRRMVLRWIGARPGPSADEPVPVWPGTSLIARLATGQQSIPFGPFLALGAASVLLAPGSLTWPG